MPARRPDLHDSVQKVRSEPEGLNVLDGFKALA